MSLAEHTSFTEDVAGMAEQYGPLLDTEPADRDEDIALFETDSITIRIHRQMEADEDGPPNEDRPAFAVEDVDEEYEALVDHGYEGVSEPADYQWGRAAYVREPDGRLIELTTEWVSGSRLHRIPDGHSCVIETSVSRDWPEAPIVTGGCPRCGALPQRPPGRPRRFLGLRGR